MINKCMLKYIFFSSKIILSLVSSSSYLRSNIELINKKVRLAICITLIKKNIIVL